LHKRTIMGLLTRQRFGYDMVAPIYEIQERGDGFALVTEFVPGRTPASNGEIEPTLTALYHFFQEVGFATWQIAPGNPHAYSNFIRTSQGRLRLIDLESALVSLSYPWEELPGFLRDGHFPVFDDVDFAKLRAYVDRNGQDLRQSLGTAGLKQLVQSIDAAELHTQRWYASEPRIWGRIARRLYYLLNARRLWTRLRARLDGAEAMAVGFVAGAIDRWEEEGQIDAGEAASLRRSLSSSTVQTLLRHLGAHLALTVAIAIPIPGLRSVARFLWTLSWRLKALVAYRRRQITREEYDVARSIHTLPVMLFALIPAAGAVAYALSGPMMKGGLGRVLVDQSAHKIPFGLYHRLGLSRITARQLASSPGGVPTDEITEPAVLVRPARIGWDALQPSGDAGWFAWVWPPNGAISDGESLITVGANRFPSRYGAATWMMSEAAGAGVDPDT
jgi:hypothetical protein